MEHAGRHLPRAGERYTVLDFGYGNGIFQEFAKNGGWRASGGAPGPAAVGYCTQRGLDVQCGGIGLFEGQGERFDWIALCHVIKHVHEPVALLAACYRLLSRGEACDWRRRPSTRKGATSSVPIGFIWTRFGISFCSAAPL